MSSQKTPAPDTSAEERIRQLEAKVQRLEKALREEREARRWGDTLEARVLRVIREVGESWAAVAKDGEPEAGGEDPSATAWWEVRDELCMSDEELLELLAMLGWDSVRARILRGVREAALEARATA